MFKSITFAVLMTIYMNAALALDLENLRYSGYNINNYSLLSHEQGLRRIKEGHSNVIINRALRLINDQEFNLCEIETDYKHYPASHLDACLFVRHLEMLVGSKLVDEQIFIRFEDRMLLDYLSHIKKGRI